MTLIQLAWEIILTAVVLGLMNLVIFIWFKRLNKASAEMGNTLCELQKMQYTIIKIQHSLEVLIVLAKRQELNKKSD